MHAFVVQMIQFYLFKNTALIFIVADFLFFAIFLHVTTTDHFPLDPGLDVGKEASEPTHLGRPFHSRFTLLSNWCQCSSSIFMLTVCLNSNS